MLHIDGFQIRSISISCSLLCHNILGNLFLSTFCVIVTFSCNIFHHSVFPSSQCVSVITVFFRHHSMFLSSQCVSVITVCFPHTAYLWSFSSFFYIPIEDFFTYHFPMHRKMYKRHVLMKLNIKVIAQFPLEKGGLFEKICVFSNSFKWSFSFIGTGI